MTNSLDSQATDTPVLPEKRGLVLSGGGGFGAFQAGALHQIQVQYPDREYDLFAGISIGGLHAAFLMQFEVLSVGVSRLIEMWKGLSRKDVWKYSLPTALTDSGFVSTAPLDELIYKQFDPEAARKTGKQLRLGTVELTLGNYVTVTEKFPDLRTWIKATSSFPIMFPCVKHDGGVYSDGGVVSLTPLASAVRAGCTHIDVIQSSPARIGSMPAKKLKHVWQVPARILSVALHHSWMKDLSGCHEINKQIECGEHAEKHRSVDVTVWAPAEAMPFDSMKFKPDEIEQMIRWGKEADSASLGAFLETQH